MARFDYELFDADQHYYEPRDAFVRYMEPKHRDLAIHVERDRDGGELVLFTSDYPHPEGLSRPQEFGACVEGLPEGQIRSIMRENCRRIVAPA